MGKRSKSKPVQAAPQPKEVQKDFLEEQRKAIASSRRLKDATLFAGRNRDRDPVETQRPTLLGSFAVKKN